jgi:glycosyltransferase involved in cell wall biosynthesis
MVTGKRPELPRRAIACYLAQTYPNKELVIVDHGDNGLAELVAELKQPDIMHIRVPDQEGLTIGDLRNMTMAAARGEYVAQWDDDDWHAERRLEVQHERLRGAAACFLWRLTLAWPKRNLFGISHKRIWEASMMVKADVLPEYPSVRLSEDEIVVRKMIEAKVRIRLIEQPELYTYVVHGNNSWGESHFEGFFQDPGFRRMGTEAGMKIAERLETV